MNLIDKYSRDAFRTSEDIMKISGRDNEHYVCEALGDLQDTYDERYFEDVDLAQSMMVSKKKARLRRALK